LPGKRELGIYEGTDGRSESHQTDFEINLVALR